MVKFLMKAYLEIHLYFTHGKNELNNLPTISALERRQMPYVFAVDNAFPLKCNIIMIYQYTIFRSSTKKLKE